MDPAAHADSLPQKDLLQALFSIVLRERPSDVGGLGQFQVLVDRGLADPAALSNVVLGEPFF
jgi:hypothetical protein